MNFSIKDGATMLFTNDLPTGSTLYKGFNTTEEGIPPTEPCWFTTTENNAKPQGKIVKKFITKKTISLINISSTLFKMHFTDQINMRFPYDEAKDILLPLGVPDVAGQQLVIGDHTVEPKVNRCTVQNTKLKNKVKFYNNQSHYFGNKLLDVNMVKQMAIIYGPSIKGYFQLPDVPSCWGSPSIGEVCLFVVDSSTIALSNPSASASTPVKQTQVGRGLDSDIEGLNGDSYLLLRQGFTKKEVEDFRKSRKRPERIPTETQKTTGNSKYPYPNFFDDTAPFCGWAAQQIKWKSNSKNEIDI